MQQELLFFSRTFLAGTCLAVCYDLLWIFRRIVKHSSFFIGMEDILYGCAAGFFLFSVIYQENDGIIRAYALFAVFSGVLLYQMCRKRLKFWLIRCKIFLGKQEFMQRIRKRENEKKKKKKSAEQNRNA